MDSKGNRRVRVDGHDTPPLYDVTRSTLSSEAVIGGQDTLQLHDVTIPAPSLEAFIGSRRRDVTGSAFSLEALIGGHDSPVRRTVSMPRPRASSCESVRASPSNLRGVACTFKNGVIFKTAPF